eukprot:1560953-Amphidinium_carterae.1
MGQTKAMRFIGAYRCSGLPPMGPNTRTISKDLMEDKVNGRRTKHALLPCKRERSIKNFVLKIMLKRRFLFNPLRLRYNASHAQVVWQHHIQA